MDKLRVRMVGKRDTNGKLFFMTTCEVPILVDLSDSVLHLFVDKNMKGGELVIRHRDRDVDYEADDKNR